jgi:hypothetical protein
MTVSELFLLAGAVEHDGAVERFLTEPPDELHAIAQRGFARMRACGDDVRELIHDGCPVACVDDAAFGYVNIFKAHVNVGFFNGAVLRDSAQVLRGSGKRMRHIRIEPFSDADSSAIDALIEAAYRDVRSRLAERRC